MPKKAEYSRRLKKGVAAAGGASSYRSRMGYLPSGYHQNPKKFASELSPRQKARVRKMHKSLSAAGFKRIYGFPRGKKK